MSARLLHPSLTISALYLQTEQMAMENYVVSISHEYATSPRVRSLHRSPFTSTRQHGFLKKYKCRFCDHDTDRLADMRRHVRSHLGIRPFRCSICNHSFVRKFHCSFHIRHVHKKDASESGDFVATNDLNDMPDNDEALWTVQTVAFDTSNAESNLTSMDF